NPESFKGDSIRLQSKKGIGQRKRRLEKKLSTGANSRSHGKCLKNIDCCVDYPGAAKSYNGGLIFRCMFIISLRFKPREELACSVNYPGTAKSDDRCLSFRMYVFDVVRVANNVDEQRRKGINK